MSQLTESKTTTLDVLIAQKPGKSIPVPYKDHEPIFFLIQRISSLLGERNDGKIQLRELYMNGVPLRDEQESIARYRTFGSMLTYKAHTKRTLRIQSPIQTFSWVYDPEMTVSNLKCAIQDAKGYSVYDWRLVFRGKQLEDERPLREYNIHHESTVHLVQRLRGGSCGPAPSIQFSDVSDTKSIRKLGFSKFAPRGRTACKGTNIECKCECTPDHRVICRKYFGIIELSEATFICPNCHRHDTIVPVTVGFWACKYRFHGIKINGQQYTSEWKDVNESDLFQMFDPSKQTTWKRLVIESARLGAPDDCTICLEPMHTAKSLHCGHRFHQACYNKWNSSCPLCRFNQSQNTNALILGNTPRLY
ncbi:hypothetical protein BGX34_010784 [Mortierella sp. NVP85]|nr:hypothetical protein BGX34_010784 [Mortierella sp. NVP85]